MVYAVFYSVSTDDNYFFGNEIEVNELTLGVQNNFRILHWRWSHRGKFYNNFKDEHWEYNFSNFRKTYKATEIVNLTRNKIITINKTNYYD